MIFRKLVQGLEKTRKGLVDRIKTILRPEEPISERTWEELEEILIEADLGVKATGEIIAQAKRLCQKRSVTDQEGVYAILKEIILEVLKPCATPFRLKEGKKPTVVLALGVNGVGKTTTLGKIAHRFISQGKKVMIAAADTFRAAAIEQLEVIAERAGAALVKHKEGADPAAVAFDALASAKAKGFDLLLIDTAGRLHTKGGLLEELKKLKKVLQKLDPEAPDETLLVLDATNGQNALVQARTFQEALDVTGIALVKLDGTAKGGIIVAIAKELGIPIRYVGIGEDLEDLEEFIPEVFVEALFTKNQVVEVGVSN